MKPQLEQLLVEIRGFAQATGAAINAQEERADQTIRLFDRLASAVEALIGVVAEQQTRIDDLEQALDRDRGIEL